MKEIWKDIKGYEGYYQVSNLGRVRSLKRVVGAGKNANHSTQTLNGRILKSAYTKKYVTTILSKDGKTKCFSVHKLVAEAFIPNPDNLPCVNHKDENKHNNKVDNLEWCTYKYNNEYNGRVDKCKHKISNTLKGKPLSFKWTDEQKKQISESVKRSWKKRKLSITEKEEV